MFTKVVQAILVARLAPLDGWVSRSTLPQYTPIEFHFLYSNKGLYVSVLLYILILYSLGLTLDLLMARDIMPTPVPDNHGEKRPREVEDIDDLTVEEEEQLRRLQVRSL
jgi:hypothetical protein